jgi:hypothetical protein
MWRNLEPEHLLDVRHPSGENIVTNRQSKEISENVEQRVRVMRNDERLPEVL